MMTPAPWVTLEQVDDPRTVGQSPESRGFPSCTAVIDYPGRGYRAMLGWVQLVRSDDNISGGRDFEMDPFTLFDDAGDIAPRQPQILAAADWDAHLPYLGQTYPGWTFGSMGQKV